MLIPAAISLIISTIFFNLNIFNQGSFLMSSHGEPIRTGEVLGASEKINLAETAALRNDILAKITVKTLGKDEVFPLPRIYQPPQLDKPLFKLPKEASSQSVNSLETRLAGFELSAGSGAILDCDNGGLIFSKRPDRPWPIASITKLFTAFVFLDYNPGWDTNIEIKPEDKREGGRIYLFTGDIVTVKDLFYFSLVGSDNTATAALVRASGMSEAEFVEKINFKIKEFGFKNSRIADPIGLQDGNISTAREVAQFAKISFMRKEISSATLTKSYEFFTKQGRKKIIFNTNELLNNFSGKDISILGGKTGYLNSSGYCLVSQFKDNNKGRMIITVVLGAESNSDRFDLTRKLADLYYQNEP